MDLPGMGRTPMDSAKASAASFSALFTSMAVASQSSLMTPSASFFSVTFIGSQLLLRRWGRLMRPVRFARYSSTGRTAQLEHAAKPTIPEGPTPVRPSLVGLQALHHVDAGELGAHDEHDDDGEHHGENEGDDEAVPVDGAAEHDLVHLGRHHDEAL